MREQNIGCTRPDGTCPAYVVSLDVEESGEVYSEMKEAFREMQSDPAEFRLNREEFRKEVNVEYALLMGGAEKIQRLRKSNNPENKLCDNCPFK